MIHVTVDIAQFFAFLITQMAIVIVGLLAAGVIVGAGALAVWRYVARRRRARSPR